MIISFFLPKELGQGPCGPRRLSAALAATIEELRSATNLLARAAATAALGRGWCHEGPEN